MNTVAIYNINMAKYRLIVKKGNKNQKNEKYKISTDLFK